MNEVFVNVGLSLDGSMSPQGMTLEHWGDPAYKSRGEVGSARDMGPQEPPFHTAVCVLTYDRRDPLKRPRGTIFYFINDGPKRARERGRASAGSRDVRISTAPTWFSST